MLRKIWSKLSDIGVMPFTNEGTRFEVHSINQLSILAFILSFGGLVFNSIAYGLGTFQYVLLAYCLVYLLAVWLNSRKQYFWAKLAVFYNFQIYHFLLGLNFGLDSQAQIIYIIAIVFVFLFFSEEARWQRIVLMVSAMVFPAVLFAKSYQLLPLDVQFALFEPPAIDITVYFTSIVFSALVMYMTFENLRNLVKKYTRKNIDLLNANAAIKAKAQERTDLFAQVIHDLKSPVHSLVGLTSLLEDERDQSVRNDILSKSNQLIHELHNKVEEELDRFKDEKYELEIEPVNMDRELQKVLNLVRFYHGFKKVKLMVNIDQEVPLYTDVKYFNVIIGNLVSNAIKYADFENKQPELHIDGKVTEEEATMKVRDNGIGISQDKMPQIFNKLFRATDYGEGSGIGLSLVKKAIDTLGGKVELDSNIGEGTTVNFTILNLNRQNGETAYANGNPTN